MKQRIFSGIQPTGCIHLGNYLGAIKQWIPYQDQADCLFCIVDLHALTTKPDPKILQESILDTAAMYLACGIQPEKSCIFVQSSVPYHAELMWILSCFTPIGFLNRMTQFKEKAGKKREQANLGLYSYPVLQAADILLYNTTHVPVGEDQKQHIELARDIAGMINHFTKTSVFKLPEPIITQHMKRIMSLRDGTKKMSKSDPSESSRLHIKDTPDDLYKKIRKAKTDSLPFPSQSEELATRPEVENLINIYHGMTNISLNQIFNTFQGCPLSLFKEALIDTCTTYLTPIREHYFTYRENQEKLKAILKEGTQKAQDIAAPILEEVRTTLGLFY